MITMRAQVSLEFLTVISTITLFILLFYVVSYQYYLFSAFTKERLDGVELALTSSFIMNNVYLGGDGAWINTSIGFSPNDRFLFVFENTVTMFSNATSIADAPLVTSSITQGKIQNNTVVISNKNDYIMVG